MSKNQFTGTATPTQRNRKFCQFNKDQYCRFPLTINEKDPNTNRSLDLINNGSGASVLNSPRQLEHVNLSRGLLDKKSMTPLTLSLPITTMIS